MKNTLTKTVKYTFRLLLIFLASILLYLLTAIILTLIPSNSSSEQPAEGIDIYLISNGFHMDLVLPATHKIYHWNDFIDFTQFHESTKPPKFLAFGWGDKGFFYDAPTVNDLTISTTLNAIFLPSPSVMHVILFFGRPVGQDVHQITLSPQQYEALVMHIQSGFQRNEQQQIIPLTGDGYGHVTDKFYQGTGSYSLFTTCNSWINQGLKKAGVKTATWAPFDWCTLYYFD
ncbi:MAG: TIGR02117 family protein [Flammeovirgaceae bacterium]